MHCYRDIEIDDKEGNPIVIDNPDDEVPELPARSAFAGADERAFDSVVDDEEDEVDDLPDGDDGDDIIPEE